MQRTECTCKSKQLGQALKKCFNRNTLPRLQAFILGCRLKGKTGTTRRKLSRQYLPCSSYALLEGVSWSHRDSGFYAVDSGFLVLDMKVPDSCR